MRHRLAIVSFVIAVSSTALFIEDQVTALLVMGGISALFIALVGIGITTIRFNWFLKSLCKARPNQVCFTFDDGPNTHTSKLLDVLKTHDAKASFFVIGENCEKNPELVKRMAAEGHVVGNHSYEHSNRLTWSSTTAVREDLERANAIIAQAIGKKVQAYRPPFGVTNPKIARAAQAAGMITIGWSSRTYDTNGKSAEAIVKKVKSNLASGRNIILMHDTCEASVEALDQLIPYCKEKGMEVVGVDKIKLS